MGGNAVLGNRVHLLSANLQLDALMARADDGGVDRLVVVLLWVRDVVLEPARYRVPSRVHHRESAVAVLDLRHDDAEGIDVGELLERNLLPLHLAPDGVGLRLAPGDGPRDLGSLGRVGTRELERADPALAP